MALRDSRDNLVSTSNRFSLDRYETALDLFHGYFGDPIAAIDGALREDPDFVMGHCLRAGVLLSTTEKPLLPAVKESLDAAERLRHRANERERAHMAAIAAWLDGDWQRSNETYGAILAVWPRDSLALQLAHLGDFYLGQSQLLRDRTAAVLPQWSEGVPGFGYLLGMHAFGLEEMGEYGRAEATGRRALSLQRRDPWAVHAVAHVKEMLGEHAAGLRWLNERVADWAPDNMLAFHNWWHLALLHLDLGHHQRVLEIYDQAIRPKPSEVVLEMVDAAALLWRLHLRGIDVGKRWKELTDTWAQRTEEGYYAFNDMHAMMCFVANARPASARSLLRTLSERAAESRSNGVMTREVALPICRALDAFGREDYLSAVEELLPVRAIAHRFGGSHAQRDVIQQTLIEAALRAGLQPMAEKLIAERTETKPSSPYNWALTSRVRELVGDADGASLARGRAGTLATPFDGAESALAVH